MSQPLVSIVLATYNGEKFLKEQLDSLVNQSYKNIELIVQDDCSDDNSVEIIKSYQTRLNLSLFENEKNLGYIKNFETLLKRVEGEYIAMCDQDDIWQSDKIETLVKNIGSNSLIYSDSLLIDEKSLSLNKSLSQKLKNSFIDSHSALNFLYDNCVSAHAMLFKKELLKQISEFPKTLYFDNYIAAVAANYKGVKYLDSELVLYRQHSKNTLSSKKKKPKTLQEKISSKVKKKESEVFIVLEKIDEMLRIKDLKNDDLYILQKLKTEYEKFETSWFNFQMFFLLLKNKDELFKITTKNRLSLIFKKSIGKKLYKVMPFL